MIKPVSEMSNAELIAEARRRDERRREGKPLTPEPGELVERDEEIDARREKAIQADVVKLYRAFGCQVYNLSQARASKQTSGLPDIWCFFAGADRDHSLGWWHEVKTPTGKQSEGQLRFDMLCKSTDTFYVLGGVRAAEEHLISFGIAERVNGTLEPARR